tara:strand:- start:19940 stop:21112 length:1173 start_codon:yes stop_codon:yes gene_type:complete
LIKNNLEFNNTKIAFSHKSNYELRRAYYLFKILSLGYISKVGRKLLKLLIRINFPLNSLILKTIYAQFCGGRDIFECKEVITKLKKNNVYSILDYSIEGSVSENDFENSMNKCLNILSACKSKNLSKFIVFKPSAVGRFLLYKKVSSKINLTVDEKNEWRRVEDRFMKICSEASKNDIMVLVDAEESWIQNAIDELVFKMMENFNKNKAVIYNTLQAYRRDRYDYLTKIHKNKTGKFKIGIKLVRGAYMEKERKRAVKYNYPCPICDDKSQTDKIFDNSLEYIIQNIDDFGLFIGSHNEKSNLLSTKLLKKNKINKKDDRIWFSQLYGMSDNISFSLADNGYNVAKYLPFGPINEVMPYLIRRLDENSSISSQTNRELQLIKAEIKRRKT